MCSMLEQQSPFKAVAAEPPIAASSNHPPKTTKKAHRGGRKQNKKRAHTTSSIDTVLLETVALNQTASPTNPMAHVLIMMPSTPLPSERSSVQQPIAEQSIAEPGSATPLPATILTPMPVPTSTSGVKTHRKRSHRGRRGGRKHKRPKNSISDMPPPAGVDAAASTPAGAAMSETQGLECSEWWVADELMQQLSLPI